MTREARLVQRLDRLGGANGDTSPGSHWQPPAADGDGLADTYDLEINLSGQSSTSRAPISLHPSYAGQMREECAIAAIIKGHKPGIGIVDSRAVDRPMAIAAAIEAPHRINNAMDNIAARLLSAMEHAVMRVARGETIANPADKPLMAPPEHCTARDINWLRYMMRRVIVRMFNRRPHWYVGWRHTNAASPSIQETARMPDVTWRRLEDDGQRFYADPFVFCHEGRTWLFVEEYPLSTAKGIISVVEMGTDGPIGKPVPVLEREGHLSYPFVFERDGKIWMIPESASIKTVDLYEAEDFPFKWRHHSTLLSGIEVGDATIVEHDERLWMFGTVGGGGASSWDALHIWSSKHLDGPWTPHPKNPVLLDARSARPAGMFFRRNGELWRPAQDCSEIYGGALALCRVVRLDEEHFEQRVETVLKPDQAKNWPAIGFHTLNQCLDIEVIDSCEHRRAGL